MKSFIGEITTTYVENKQGDNYGDVETPKFSTITDLHCDVDLHFDDEVGMTCFYLKFEHLNGEIQDLKIDCDIFLNGLDYMKLMAFAFEYANKMK